MRVVRTQSIEMNMDDRNHHYFDPPAAILGIDLIPRKLIFTCPQCGRVDEEIWATAERETVIPGDPNVGHRGFMTGQEGWGRQN